MHVLEWGPASTAQRSCSLHGNPTWGFLWRKVVAAIRARPAAPSSGWSFPI